jgi:hypothetical protein
MTKEITRQQTDCFSLPALGVHGRRNALGLSAADFRRISTDLKSRPPSQRTFLRKLLRRAIANGAPTQFPVTNHAVGVPVMPS